MGRIRNLHIKKAAEDLLRKYPDKLTEDFEKNKKALSELGITVSKSTRNKIVGYISHLVKKQRKLQTNKIFYQAKEADRKSRRRGRSGRKKKK